MEGDTVLYFWRGTLVWLVKGKCKQRDNDEVGYVDPDPERWKIDKRWDAVNWSGVKA
jgi:hypothetical protein